MNKTYIVRLTDDERQALVQLTKSGKTAAYKIKHAHILLHVDANGPNWSDAHVATALHCHGNTVRNVRQRFVEQGLAAALVRKKQATALAPVPPGWRQRSALDCLAVRSATPRPSQVDLTVAG